MEELEPEGEALLMRCSSNAEIEDKTIYFKLFIEMLSISDVEESFKAAGYLRFKMRNIGEDAVLSYDDVSEIVPFHPNAYLFANAKSITCDENEQNFSRKDNVLTGEIGWEGDFSEQFDLRTFPFDRQFFKVELQFVSNDEDKGWKVEDGWNVKLLEPTNLRLSSGVLMNEWKLDTTWHRNVIKLKDNDDEEDEREEDDIEKNVVKKGAIDFFVFQFRCERRFVFFVQQVVIPLFCIVSLGFIASIYQVTDASDRISIILTLLLTSVAFKYIVANFLPRVPYLTLLDQYVLGSFGMLVLSAAEIALTFSFSQYQWVVDFDYYFWFVLYGVFFSFHILWSIFRKSCRPSWESVLESESRHYEIEQKSQIECGNKYESVAFD